MSNSSNKHSLTDSAAKSLELKPETDKIVPKSPYTPRGVKE